MNKNNQGILPPGWINAKLDELCLIIQGQSPPGETYNIEGIGVPFFQGKAEFGELYAKARKWCTAPTKIAERDDILISIRAPVGPTNLCPSTACIGRGLAAIRPLGGTSVRYVLYGIRSTEALLREKATGSTFEAISGSDLRNHILPIAPISEQHQIVEEIEKQFSRLDAGLAALKRIQAGLKRYRASVLQAACEGRLVPTEAELACKECRDYEPADELLKRILVERREKWEADQLARMQSQGKPPKDDKWKSKYQEPTLPDTSELPELPEGWCWTNMSNIIISGPQNGLYLPQSAYGRGIPILRIDDYQNGWSRSSSELRLVDASKENVNTYSLNKGDIVINRVNSLTHLGKCIRISHRNIPALFESNMMRLHLADCINVAYIESYLHSNQGRKRLTQNAKWAVNQASINQKDVGDTPVPLAPLNEQERIVLEIERRLSVIEELDATIEASIKRGERLRQAILRRAFEGKLIAQDSSDEPALILLACIRAEREEVQRNGNTKSRTKKIKETTMQTSMQGLD